MDQAAVYATDVIFKYCAIKIAAKKRQLTYTMKRTIPMQQERGKREIER